MGPVQVLVVGFDRPTFSGEVLAELTRLREAGIVRLVDLLLVSRAEDGTFQTVDTPGEIDGHPGTGAAALLGWSEDADSGDADETSDLPVWSLADTVPVGSMAAVALIEHLWAVPLRAAIQRAGGRPLEETWLTASDVERLETLIAEPDE